MNSQNNNQITHIHCDVKNCVYHDRNGVCTAKNVSVGPTFAVSSADTICSTFKSR